MGKSDTTIDFNEFIALIALMPFLILLQGSLLSHFWLWFISEPFNVFEIKILHACGLSVFYDIIIYKSHNKKRDEDGEAVLKMFETFFILGVTFFIGWIIHIFM